MPPKISPRLRLPDNDRVCPDSVSTVAGRADLGPDLKRKLLGDSVATLFNLKA